VRCAAAAGVAALLAGCGGAPRAQHGDGPRTALAPPAATKPAPLRARPGEALALALARPTLLRATPGGRALAAAGRRTPFGSPTVLAIRRVRGAWAAVLWPALGNGRVGWVPLRDGRVLRETWSIDVVLHERRAVLRHRGRAAYRFAVAVGTAAYPTPTGRFAVTDRLRTGGPASPYGCCILALTARQPHVPQDWPGGDRIAIHGTDEPATVGTAASHGCLRASAAAMRVLMARVPLGTPVRIRT
jgi:hypothetical protein